MDEYEEFNEELEDIYDINTLEETELEIIDDNNDIIENIENEEKIEEKQTTNYITKYEKAKIIGFRAQQLSKGAAPSIDIGEEYNPYNIALMELEQNRLPLMIKRKLPNGNVEYWKTNELIII
jgi:DNA-directed RNA polymerase I, II, and III subunit RPABC2